MRVSELLTVMSTLAWIIDGSLPSLLRSLGILRVHLVANFLAMFGLQIKYEGKALFIRSLGLRPDTLNLSFSNMCGSRWKVGGDGGWA